MNLRDKYLSVKTCATGTVEIPDWGTVNVRSLTLSEMDRLEKAIGDNPADALAVAVLLGVGDEDGKRVFDDKDIASIRATTFNTVKAVAEAVVRHNKLNAEVVAEAKKD
jgi:hypothetical protein